MNILVMPSNKDLGEYRTDTLYQWDLNQKLVLEGSDLDAAPLVHFNSTRDKTAYVVQSTLASGTISADIPNVLLEKGEDLYAFVVISDTTMRVIRIPVEPRAKPNDYVSNNDNTTTWDQIMAAFNSVIKSAKITNGELIFVKNDNTTINLGSIVGPKGDEGDPGAAFTYADFTPEQLSALKVKGDKGDPFTYADFTQAQLESLKVKGDKGDTFTYADLTPEQIASFKGAKGDPFTYADFTQAQLADIISQTSDAVIDASDLGQYAKKTELATHNAAADAHTDIRQLVTALTTRLNAVADSDDITLDQLSEIVAYIKSNSTLIESITTSKANAADVYTKTEVDSKGFLTAHQSLSDYAKTTDVDTGLSAKGNTQTYHLANISVPAASFVANTYALAPAQLKTDYPFMAEIPIAATDLGGAALTATDGAWIEPAYADKIGGNYCPDSYTDSGKLVIFAKTVPATAFAPEWIEIYRRLG